MNEPRRHHLLPQFYMRPFADGRGRITVIPRGEESQLRGPLTLSIKNVLVERDYYAIEDEAGSRSFVVEKGYAAVENDATLARDVLLAEGLVLSHEQRSAWAEFMSLQVTRGRQFRTSWERSTNELNKKIIALTAANASDAFFDELNADAVARGEEPGPAITPELRRSMIDGTGFDVMPNKEHTIGMSFVAHEEMTTIFYGMTWKLLRFPEPWLFTCDQPVLYWREPNSLPAMFGIGPATAREVRIPLSPSVMLILTHPYEIDEPDDAEHVGDIFMARCLNRDMLLWPSATQWLVHPVEGWRPLPDLTLGSWDAEWRRPWLAAGSYAPYG
jgi:hypothetical protein